MKPLTFKDALVMSRRAALGIATLAAFLVQIFVADTHWHWSEFSSVRVASAASACASVSIQKQQGPLNAETCPLCQALSASSRFIAASAASILPPPAVLVAGPARQPQRAVEVRLSHSWRGRAPPKSDPEIV
jgi:hypothetical protein